MEGSIGTGGLQVYERHERPGSRWPFMLPHKKALVKWMTIGVGKLAKNANQGVRASNSKLRLYRSKGKGLEIFSQENVWFLIPNGESWWSSTLTNRGHLGYLQLVSLMVMWCSVNYVSFYSCLSQVVDEIVGVSSKELEEIPYSAHAYYWHHVMAINGWS